jgi:hypothetical protein
VELENTMTAAAVKSLSFVCMVVSVDTLAGFGAGRLARGIARIDLEQHSLGHALDMGRFFVG